MRDWCTVHSSSLLGSNVYALHLGGSTIIIDSGHPRHAPKTLDLLLRAGHLSNVTAVILTHGHADHAGAAALIHASTRAPVYCSHPAVRDKFADEERRLNLEIEPFPIDRVLVHDDRIPAGDETIRVVSTPGHSDDHLCLFLENRRALFCGDLFALDDLGTLDITHRFPESMSMMIESAGRCEALSPAVILPGHGRKIADPSGLFGLVRKRAATFQREPSIVVAHTIMPLVLLLIDSRKAMTVGEIAAYTEDHVSFFEEFLDGVTPGVLRHELDKILMILELKGAIGRKRDQVFLRKGPVAF